MYLAFTGSHGTGKTTSVFQKAKEMKILAKDKTVGIISENAMFSPLPINRDTTPNSQMWIFTNQIQSEIAFLAKYDVVISDRTAVDAIAYTFVAGFIELGKAMLELVKNHIKNYDEIYFKTLKHNNYLIADGVRDGKDKRFQKEVEVVLLDLYEKLKIRETSRFHII